MTYENDGGDSGDNADGGNGVDCAGASAVDENDGDSDCDIGDSDSVNGAGDNDVWLTMNDGSISENDKYGDSDGHSGHAVVYSEGDSDTENRLSHILL